MPGPVLIIEHEPNVGLSLMAAPLGPQVRVIRPYRGERLPESAADLSRYAGLIVLGGSMGAGDDHVAGWLPATRRLLADAVRTQLPTLGICLGAQLLAAACGGTVERGDAGLEVGVTEVSALPAAATDPFFAAIGRAVIEAGPKTRAATDDHRWRVQQFHFDAVTRLPAEAELVITGDRYPNQGFRVGSAAWGVQYHPEVSADLFAEWVAGGQRSGDLPADSTDLLASIRAAAPGQSRLAAAHAGAFLDVVRGIDAVAGLR